MASGLATNMEVAFAAITVPTTTISGQTWVQVSTAAQLEYIDEHQSTYLSANIQLMKDIDVSGFAWVPFGGDSNANFSGTFNGQGYVVSGVTVSNSTDAAVGFFGASTGTIANLGVSVNLTGIQGE